jgi:Methyltransferase domain
VIGAYRQLRSLLARLGLQVVVKSFYSPIPDLAALPGSTWERRSDLAGIRLDLDAQLGFLEGLREQLAEFRPPAATGDPDAYASRNPSYPVPDAAVLHAVVRGTRPRRIVELGSGHSTLVVAAACLANEREGSHVDYRAYDPYPKVARPRLPGLTELSRTRAEELPDQVFEALGDGDLLVVDTTHTVKTGGDVNHIVLDILPKLASGVLVHFHDVFLPWEYPRMWAEDYGLYWAEQYLLQAFLSLNTEYEVACALYALSRERPQRLRELVPAWLDDSVPGAFWIRRS